MSALGRAAHRRGTTETVLRFRHPGGWVSNEITFFSAERVEWAKFFPSGEHDGPIATGSLDDLRAVLKLMPR